MSASNGVFHLQNRGVIACFYCYAILSIFTSLICGLAVVSKHSLNFFGRVSYFLETCTQILKLFRFCFYPIVLSILIVVKPVLIYLFLSLFLLLRRFGFNHRSNSNATPKYIMRAWRALMRYHWQLL